MSARPSRIEPRPPPLRCCRMDCGERRDISHAGTAPSSRPSRIVNPPRNPSSARSVPGSESAALGTSQPASSGVSQSPISRPHTAPATESKNPSINAARASRQRPAPSASRTPISRLRPSMRSSSSVEEFAAVTSTTAPTSSSSVRPTRRKSSRVDEKPWGLGARRGVRRPKSARSSGVSKTSCRAVICGRHAASSRPCAEPIPGGRRSMMFCQATNSLPSHCARVGDSSRETIMAEASTFNGTCSPSGSQASTPLPTDTPTNAAGAMPTTVSSCPLTRIGRPTAAGSPPSLRCHQR